MKKKIVNVDTVKVFDLNLHVHRLLIAEPFFAAISRNINKTPCSSIPTAGVRICKDSLQFEMLYNPQFFLKLTEEERSDVLKHEYYHLIFEHLTTRKPAGAEQAKNWNFATDLAINSYLENIPEGCCIPGKKPFEQYESKKASEYYFNKIKEDERFKPQTCSACDGTGEISPDSGSDSDSDSGQGQQQQQQNQQKNDASSDSHNHNPTKNPCPFCNGVGEGQFDDHSMWDDIDEQSKAVARERMKNIMRKAVQEAGEKGWGTITGEIKQDILRRIQSKVDWRKVLRYFVKTSQRSDKRSTVRRINKRFPYVHPGKHINRHAKIAISIDQSGSVDDEMLSLFFAELYKLSTIAEFTVIPFDSEVDEENIFVWKKGQKINAKRTKCGGTNFNAPTKWVNENGVFDGHIILTDMCAPKPVASRVQRLWMTTPENAEKPYFQTNERVVAIERPTDE